MSKKGSILDEVKATLEIEGLTLPKETEVILAKYFAGSITIEELGCEVKQQVQRIIEK